MTVDGAQKILVVEDDAVTRARLAFLLRKNGYQVEVTEDGEAGWAAFRAGHFPIVLTDWSMPGLSGPDLVRRIREYDQELYTYLILITGKSDKAHIATGLEAGADDYVTKPFDSGELLARLRTGWRILSLQERMREAQRKLHELASRDGLTGVLNRRALEERLAEAFHFFQRRGPPLSLLMLDLDHFKHINDTYGHQAGDDVLRDAAKRVGQLVREYDFVGRYGGEEFMVVLPDTPADEAAQIAERIRRAVADSPIATREGGDVHATVSVGVATLGDGFAGQLKDVVEAADGALYVAKREGRNRVQRGTGPGLVDRGGKKSA